MRITCPNCRGSMTISSRRQLSKDDKGCTSDLFRVYPVCNHCRAVAKPIYIETVLDYVPDPVSFGSTSH